MDRYAFLLTAMSMEDAKSTLGFPPGSTPTPGEIKDAYLEKAKKLHPDVGGDLEAMTVLNVAKDILEGKARPSYDRRDVVSEPPPRWKAPEPPKRVEVTFQQAESKGGIPSGVQWFFVTDYQHGKKSWSSDESSRGESAFVAYGRTENQHVFVGAHHYTRQDYYIGGTEDKSIWTIKSNEFPIRAEEGKNPAWLYGNVVRALKDVDFDGRFNSKVLDAQGWKFGSKFPTGTETSIKHWLVGSGQVAGDAPSVVGRKHVVEIKVNKSFQPKPGYYEETHHRGNFWDGKYHGDYLNIVLTINGRPYDLSEKDVKTFTALRMGSSDLMDVIFGRYHYDGSKKQLTKIRMGKKILGWLARNLTDLPKEAVETLQAAEAQMKG
jgi:hypothetical protein